MITIDGSEGEGGGQVLRTALALSLATGTPFRIEQHPRAAAEAGAAAAAPDRRAGGGRGRRARASKATRSDRAALTFTPQAVQPGDYAFAVGTAGSATLVLQTILPPLLLAARPVDADARRRHAQSVRRRRSTFCSACSCRSSNRLGPRVEAALERPRVLSGRRRALHASTIDPAPQLARLELLDRGEIVGRRVRALVANLPRHIAEREVATALRLLNWSEESASVEVVADAPGPGNVVFVEIESRARRPKSARASARSGTAAEAVADARSRRGAAVSRGRRAGRLPPRRSAAAGAGARRRRHRSGRCTLSRHALTNADVVRQFVDVDDRRDTREPRRRARRRRERSSEDTA